MCVKHGVCFCVSDSGQGSPFFSGGGEGGETLSLSVRWFSCCLSICAGSQWGELIGLSGDVAHLCRLELQGLHMLAGWLLVLVPFDWVWFGCVAFGLSLMSEDNTLTTDYTDDMLYIILYRTR